jgi:hypothetical protein
MQEKIKISILQLQRRGREAGHVARMGMMKNAYRILAGNVERRKTLGRPRRRSDESLKMDV